MKCLVIGGNRYVGLRLAVLLNSIKDIELHILNRTGQAPHCPGAVAHKGDRRLLSQLYVDKEWDVVFDFAAYTESDAAGALDFFKRVGKYIFISTASVYNPGENLREEAFAPQNLDLKLEDTKQDYQSGKRRAEAIFSQRAPFPFVSVRFPVILGPDDYTERLTFHTGRVKRSEGIYFPNHKAKVSMVHAEDAARGLFWLLSQSLTGPLNMASERPISMTNLLLQIELVTGFKAVIATQRDEENASPYCPDQNWYMSTDRLNKAGFVARPILDWLPELIGTTEAPKGFVH